MGLFVDTDVVTAADLGQVDSEAVLAANTAKPPIVLDGDRSIAESAWNDCQHEVLAAMQSYVSFPAQTGMPATHLAAITNVGVPARTQARVRLNQIVVSDSAYLRSHSPFHVWMTYHALANLFRDASIRMGKDRYEEKYLRYLEVSKACWRKLRSTGLPFVYQPLEAPGAKHAFSAGTWSAANLSGTGGSPLTGQSLVVAITWVDGSKYKSQTDKHNAESGHSELLTFTVPDLSYLTVSIASLNPPNGQPDPVGLAGGTWTPLNASGWNIWVGQPVAPNSNLEPVMYLQQENIPIATKSFTIGDPVYSGSILGKGQYADLNLVFMNVAMRG